jgi:ketosteroid isomerase-like protein
MGLPLVLAVTLAVLAIPALAHEPSATVAAPAALAGPVKEAAAAVDAFHAALARGDGPGALALLADDALVFESGGVESSKARYAAEHLAADMAFSTAVPSTLVRRSGGIEGALAWVASEGRTTGSWKGKAVDRVSTETMILRRSAEGWKIAHIHWSSAPAPSN